MSRPVDYLRSRSLSLLALVQSARIVFGTAAKRTGKQRLQVAREPSGNPGQLRLEGIR